jgi:hypothetical protein
VVVANALADAFAVFANFAISSALALVTILISVKALSNSLVNEIVSLIEEVTA